MEKKLIGKELDDISIQGVRINYIYSFFLGIHKQDNKNDNVDDNVDDKIILDWNSAYGNSKVPLKSLFRTELFKDDVEKNHLKTIVEYHESEEKEPLNNRSALYLKFPHLSIKKKYLSNVKIKNLFNKDKNGSLSIHVAFFQTGMGVMWVSIEVDDKNGLPNDEICNINQRIQIPSIDGLTPHDFFKNEISELESKINNVLFPFFLNCKNESCLLWKDESNNYERGTGIFQEPAIAILLKSNNYLECINKESFQLYLSSILHGTGFSEVDIKHAKEHIGEHCQNLFPSKRFFTQLHGNCLLVIHNEQPENDNKNDIIELYNPLKEFTYGLFRTYCAVRGTWYMYNLLNEEIDDNLKKLNYEIESDIEIVKKAQKTRNFIILKSHFLQFVNSEDPFVRGIGLTQFSKLYEEALDIYKPDEIKKNIRYKLNEYDKLISAINTYNYYSAIKTDTINKNNNFFSGLKVNFIPIVIFILIVIMLIIKYFIKLEFSTCPTYNVLLFVFSVSLFSFIVLKLFSK